jgi:hypothetical protein
VRWYKVYCETRGRAAFSHPLEKEEVMYRREFVINAETEADAIAQAKRTTDTGPYTGENFKVVRLCLRCNGSGRLQREDVDTFIERLKKVPKAEKLACIERWKADSVPCPECQN